MTVHCLAAFVFNLGVLAFTINVLAAARPRSPASGDRAVRRGGEEAGGDDHRRADHGQRPHRLGEDDAARAGAAQMKAVYSTGARYCASARA